ncbi:TonB-dependent receptor [Bradyrhizobium sp. SYSU BS000235]|uniref:TonB-dependent receptor n=1 Tax=Bradyrhizobium sp. SYSU BS000235 TaxID=3411332 RepID=UPI003C791EC9
MYRGPIGAVENNGRDNNNMNGASVQALSSFVRAAKKPAPAMLSLASMMLATGAIAQEALPTIDVQETNNNGANGGGYQATSSQLSRIPTPLIDTPQTINVVPKQVIQEQRQTTMEDALRSVPGITFAAGEGGQQGDSPIIRGFAARGDLFRDGVRDPGWYTRDLFSANSVEVYKGPSAFAFGRGATGGAINVTSKLPTFNPVPYLEGTVTGSTGPGIRAELDAAGTKGEVSGRIAALYQDVDTPTRDDVYVKRWGVAPSISANVDDKTKVTLSYLYQGEESRPDYGFTFLPTPSYNKQTGALNPGTGAGYYGNGAPTPPMPTPRDTWFGVRDGDLRDLTTTETHMGTFKVEREITDDVKLANTTRYIVNDRYSLPTALRNFGAFSFNQNPFTMTVGRERRQRWTDNTYAVNQTDLNAKFETWGVRHTLAAGLEFTSETRSQTRIDRCDPADPACRNNVMNPYPIGSPTGGLQTVYNPVNTGANNQAVFVTDQVKFNKYFELLGSIRYDRFSTVYDDWGIQPTPVPAHFARVDNLTSYRVGAIGHPTSNSSVYIAYGNSYNPSAELGTLTSPSLAALAPEQTKTLEVGAKADVLNNQLSLSGSIFRIEKTNLRIMDPINTTVSVLDGIARVDGVEFGVVGKLTDQWSIFAGYSYLQSRILDTRDLSLLGRELPNTPHNNLTVWSTYAITPDWTIGGGATYQSMAWASQNDVSYVPDYWKFDAMVSYKVTPNSTLQLNVYNLTDKLYYAQYSGGNVVPASGRWASLTYRYKFEPPPAVTPDKVVK